MNDPVAEPRFSVAAVAERLVRIWGERSERAIQADFEQVGLPGARGKVHRIKNHDKNPLDRISHDVIAATVLAYGADADWLLTGRKPSPCSATDVSADRLEIVVATEPISDLERLGLLRLTTDLMQALAEPGRSDGVSSGEPGLDVWEEAARRASGGHRSTQQRREPASGERRVPDSADDARRSIRPSQE